MLAYSPRRSVPWGAVAPLVVIAIPLINAVVGYGAADSQLDDIDLIPATLTFIGVAVVAPISAVSAATAALTIAYDSAVYTLRTENYVNMVWAGVATNLALAGLFHLGLALFSRASVRDLGWPTSARQLVEDVRIGGVACLAALLPVYAIQLMLVFILAPERTHPLIESYVRNPSGALALAAGVSAVIAAPLFEETVFRVMFQGWLEKCEDALRGWAPYRPARVVDAAPIEQTDPETLPIGSGAPQPTFNDALHRTRIGNPWDDPTTAPAELPARLSGRHGWTPIVVSGVLFGLAHLGHGVAPVSLIVLGMVLGYVYQRTHRIVPCIVCHMLFNAFSLGILWIQVSAAG